jgi:FMN phosphatase YigB (HAD superfamily)
MSSNPEKRFSAPVIALDIGNVSMKLNFDGMYRRFDVDPGDSAAVGRLWEHGAALETGRCTVPEFLDRLYEFAGHRHTREYLLDAWRCGVQEPMPGMLETVCALAERGVRFSFMSDISPIHLDQVFKYCEFVHLVTGGIYSFEAGAFKLDGSAMFDAFERRYGRPLAFFDDRIEIIEHARGLGWNAIRFESPEQVLRDATALLDKL